MAVYIRDFLKVLPEEDEILMRGKISYAFRKELNLRQRKIVDAFVSQNQVQKCEGNCVDKVLKDLLVSELDKIAEEMSFIYKIDGEKYFKEIKETYFEVLSEIDVLAEKLGYMIMEVGAEEAKKKIVPWKTDFYVKSDKLSLCGRVHKVMREQNGKDEEFYPVEIKTGENKIFFGSESDRVQVCAYTMLLEDLFNKSISYGFLYYARTGETIPVMNTEHLRRKVLLTRNEVLEISRGKTPVFQVNKNKCRVCVFRSKCASNCASNSF